MREEVGHDAVLAGVVVQARRQPLLPGAGQVVEQLAVVDAEQRLVGVLGRRDQLGAGRQQGRADQLGPLRQLGSRRADADPDLSGRPVQGVALLQTTGIVKLIGRLTSVPFVLRTFVQLAKAMI